MENKDIIRFLAIWQLVHEVADDALKGSIQRGNTQKSDDMSSGDVEFVDGLAALVNEEKESIKLSLTQCEKKPDTKHAKTPVSTEIEELKFEIAELRGAVESLKTSVDALRAQNK